MVKTSQILYFPGCEQTSQPYARPEVRTLRAFTGMCVGEVERIIESYEGSGLSIERIAENELRSREVRAYKFEEDIWIP